MAWPGAPGDAEAVGAGDGLADGVGAADGEGAADGFGVALGAGGALVGAQAISESKSDSARSVAIESQNVSLLFIIRVLMMFSFDIFLPVSLSGAAYLLIQVYSMA